MIKGLYRSSVTAGIKAALFLSCVLIVYFRQSPYAGNFLWAAVGFSALVRGRWEERVVAVVIFLAVVATRLATPEDLGAPRYGVLIVDMIETTVLTIIALRSGLWWPTWCAGCHIAALSSHAIFMLRPDLVEPWVYVSGLLVWSWLGFMPLAFGTLDVCLSDRARSAPARA